MRIRLVISDLSVHSAPSGMHNPDTPVLGRNEVMS